MESPDVDREVYHVFPTGEGSRHATELPLLCPCGPEWLMDEDSVLIVHNQVN